MRKLNISFDRMAKSYGRLATLWTLPDSPNRIPVLRRESWLFLKRSWAVFWAALGMWVRLRMPKGGS